MCSVTISQKVATHGKQAQCFQHDNSTSSHTTSGKNKLLGKWYKIKRTEQAEADLNVTKEAQKKEEKSLEEKKKAVDELLTSQKQNPMKNQSWLKN